MSSRPRVRLFAVLLIATVILAIPATAHALSGAEVTGTVTAAATGVKLQDINVNAYLWDDGDDEWDYYDSTSTDADGAYALYLSEGSYLFRAEDATGTYNPSMTDKVALVDTDKKKFDFALAKDMRAPVLDSYWVPEGYRMVAAIPFDYRAWDVLAARSAFLGTLMADDSVMTFDKYDEDPWYTNGSGVTSLQYSVNGGAAMAKTSADPVPSSYMYTNMRVDSEGLNTINYWATDKNGNVSRIHSELLLVDLTPPSTGYANNGKTITLKPVDALSGIAATFYRAGSTGSFTSGSSFAVPKSGSVVYEYYSVDKVGNAEAVKSLKVWSTASLSTPKVSKTSVKSGKSFTVTGSVYGRAGATGSVYVYKLTNGKYKYYSKKAYKEGSNGKFSVSLKLKKGTYKVKTHYGKNAAASANMPVLSKFSSKVKVY